MEEVERRGRMHFLSNFHRSGESSFLQLAEGAGSGTLEMWGGEGSEAGLPVGLGEWWAPG